MTTTTEITRDEFAIYAKIGRAWEKGAYRRVYFYDLEKRAQDAFANLPKRQVTALANALRTAKVYYDQNQNQILVESHDLSVLQSTFGIPGRKATALDLILQSIEAERAAIIAEQDADESDDLVIDPTTPAGASETGAVIGALQRGWTEAEIEAGVRFRGRETFVCPGCGRTFPRSMAMSASLDTVCPDCYDQFS